MELRFGIDPRKFEGVEKVLWGRALSAARAWARVHHQNANGPTVGVCRSSGTSHAKQVRRHPEQYLKPDQDFRFPVPEETVRYAQAVLRHEERIASGPSGAASLGQIEQG